MKIMTCELTDIFCHARAWFAWVRAKCSDHSPVLWWICFIMLYCEPRVLINYSWVQYRLWYAIINSVTKCFAMNKNCHNLNSLQKMHITKYIYWIYRISIYVYYPIWKVSKISLDNRETISTKVFFSINCWYNNRGGVYTKIQY